MILKNESAYRWLIALANRKSQDLCISQQKMQTFCFFCLLGKKDRTYNSIHDPEILEIRDDNSIGKRGAYETDYFSRENENFSFIQ